MVVRNQRFNIHQFTLDEFVFLENAENIISQIQAQYSEEDVLMSPNDGEIIQIEELARVKGILSFLMRNRVVEVNPKG